MSITEKYSGVELTTAGNVYFDGKCVSHDFVTADGVHKSVGVVLPAKLTFGTSKPEVMECVAGGCRYLLKGASEWKTCSPGEMFSIPENSGFDIEVADEPFHYICHYG
ncbi:pyrimidine/purine nucleoside phosphorylase [Pseudazoarcus pumilus]|uniref:Pyrimidine/purine nucleoside phosphorylase n=1 Tax=Pseudazoarcus pumilus TaxID=2067960 RepID=A0A2I6S899_9RHOO|nr:pyrimidine/purine nucleoside phosphorylase [Pseudazoarcus pumilus]AUN95500.1 hypothetical protein C0099_11525 [Pseudazoarcus pumilus]